MTHFLAVSVVSRPHICLRALPWKYCHHAYNNQCLCNVVSWWHHMHYMINKSRPEQNDPCFSDDIFNYFFLLVQLYLIEFPLNLVRKVQLTMMQHLFRWRLGEEQARSHYLNQLWLCSLTHICVPQHQLIDMILNSFTGSMFSIVICILYTQTYADMFVLLLWRDHIVHWIHPCGYNTIPVSVENEECGSNKH